MKTRSPEGIKQQTTDINKYIVYQNNIKYVGKPKQNHGKGIAWKNKQNKRKKPLYTRI